MSETFDSKQMVTDKQYVVLAQPSGNHIRSAVPPVCAHEVMSFVLFNLWTADRWPWDEIIGMDNNMWMRMLETSFTKFVRGDSGGYTQKEVRDYFNQRL